MRTIDNIFITPSKEAIHLGTMNIDGRKIKCALGKYGLTDNKREGDKATPKGCFYITGIFYRADKCPKLKEKAHHLPQTYITKQSIWIDDPNSLFYNQYATMPQLVSHINQKTKQKNPQMQHPTSYEKLWREDGIYDLLLPFNYNQNPTIPKKGSAIFLHCAQNNFAPTKGCIAIAKKELCHLLGFLTKTTKIHIGIKA